MVFVSCLMHGVFVLLKNRVLKEDFFLSILIVYYLKIDGIGD